MRIQILSQYYDPEIGASQVRLKALTAELVRQGHQVDVVTALPNYPLARIFEGYRGRLTMTEQRDGATVHRVWVHAAIGKGRGRMLNYASFALLALLPMARSPRPDVVIVESPPLFAVLPALLDRLVRRRRYVLMVADLWPDTAIEMGMVPAGWLRWALFGLERLAYGRALLVAPVTEGQVAALTGPKGVPAHKVCLVRNGVDVAMFHDVPPSATWRARLTSAGERLIVFAGTLGFAQGLDVILDAVPLVRAVHPDVRFVFVGSGSDSGRVRERVSTEGIEGIILIDPVPLAEVAEIYSVAAAGITSLRDSPVFDHARPSKIFAMMAASLPVIYSGRGEGAALVTENDAGVAAEPGDVDALAEAINDLFADPERMTDQGANGLALVQRQFAWSAIISDFVAELEQLVAP